MAIAGLEVMILLLSAADTAVTMRGYRKFTLRFNFENAERYKN